MIRLPARPVGIYAAASAVLALVLVPLLSLAYLAAGDGREDASATVRAWAEPAAALAGPLLTWGSADEVYTAYLRAVALLFPAVVLCAFAVRARRQPALHAERWGWRLALTGYTLGLTALVAVSVALLAGRSSTVVDVVYLALLLPSTLLMAVGTTVLGIGLLRARFQPRAAAWLLALALPSVVVVPVVLGHNSLGVLPVIVAWGLIGRRLARSGEKAVVAPEPAASGAAA